MLKLESLEIGKEFVYKNCKFVKLNDDKQNNVAMSGTKAPTTIMTSAEVGEIQAEPEQAAPDGGDDDQDDDNQGDGDGGDDGDTEGDSEEE